MSSIKVNVEIDGQEFAANVDDPIDIAIPQTFGANQPSFFGADPAKMEPVKIGSFVGDTRSGGSCNVASLTVIPHCNGTHTEGIGHISRDAVYVNSSSQPLLIPATLVTVIPEPRQVTSETVSKRSEPKDLVITERCLSRRMAGMRPAFLDALIIRTLPNSPEKKSRNYDEEPAPYFSLEAMLLINNLSVSHLLVDIPSIDRSNDSLMPNHRAFWGETNSNRGKLKTITEMVFVDSHVRDASYLLSLQFPSFSSDAAPSRPMLARLIPRIRPK